MPSKTRRDPRLIDSAPLLPEGEVVEDEEYLDLVGLLAAKLESVEAELVQIKAKKTIDDVRAEMLEGYSNKVFRFVIYYCVVVGMMLIASAFETFTKFKLSDTILAIIAGSTAVAMIGLIGMVITGLFDGARALSRADARIKK